MIFNFEDLKQFKVTNNTLACTATFIKPVHIVMMSAVHNYTNKSAIFSCPSVVDYVNNMRFTNPLEIDTIDGLNHSKAIKLKRNFDNDSQVLKVMKIFQNNNYLDDETNDVLHMILAEIFQNFYAHADYDQPPICCVQDWPSSNFLEISIADKGIGINNSLRDVLEQYPPNTNPCRIACDLGVSCSLNKKSRIGTSHSGYGLFYTKRFIEENDGILFLLSDNKCYINLGSRESDETLPYHWTGTVIRLVINKQKIIHSTEFFQKIAPEVDGEGYEEFF